MERALASIQTINKITAIPDADRIECLHVLGWIVVAQKGQFEVGDKCVYFEIDSILPERPEFEYMRPTKFRVRTLRLRQQLSQGVCFPLHILERYGVIVEKDDGLYLDVADNDKN